MKTLRNLAFAGTLALAAALSGGTANAAPASALEIGVPSTTESALVLAHHGHHHGHGHHHHHGHRLCHVPFFKLVNWYGYWQARMIKRRCHGHGHHHHG